MYEIIKNFPYCVQLLIVIIPIISLMISAWSFVRKYQEDIKRNQLKRAELVTNFFETLLSDSEMQAAFYSIEYDKFKYDENFHESETEKI